MKASLLAQGKSSNSSAYRILAAVLGVTLVIGFGAGFNTALVLQKDKQQDQTTTATGIGLAVASYLAAGISASGMFRAYYKDRKDEQKVPTLEFAGFIARDYDEIPYGEQLVLLAITYSVVIRKTKGIGKAEECEGHITIKEPLTRISCKWGSDAVKFCDIGGTVELVLFQLIPRVGQPEKCIFPEVSRQNTIEPIELNYNEDLLSRRVTIEVHSKNAKTPTPIEKTIGEIIAETKPPS